MIRTRVASTAGNNIGRTGTQDKMDEHHDIEMVDEGKSPFLKVHMGLSLEVENKKAAHVAMEVFTAGCGLQKGSPPSSC